MRRTVASSFVAAGAVALLGVGASVAHATTGSFSYKVVNDDGKTRQTRVLNDPDTDVCIDAIRSGGSQSGATSGANDTDNDAVIYSDLQCQGTLHVVPVGERETSSDGSFVWRSVRFVAPGSVEADTPSAEPDPDVPADTSDPAESPADDVPADNVPADNVPAESTG